LALEVCTKRAAGVSRGALVTKAGCTKTGATRSEHPKENWQSNSHGYAATKSFALGIYTGVPSR